MNDRQTSEIVTFLMGCKDVEAPALEWVKIIDEMLDDMAQHVRAAVPLYITDLIEQYMPEDIKGEMLDETFLTKYTTHIGYELSTRDYVVGAAVIMMAAVASGQPVFIHERNLYADAMIYRYRANIREERINGARDLWRAFLRKYLGAPLEPLAEELDPDY